MLLDGFNHVAVLTADTDRFVAFYRAVFEATVDGELRPGDGIRLTFVSVGPNSEFNVFELDGNEEAARQTPMFGRLDHLALQAASLEAFDEIRRRLMDRAPATALSPTSVRFSACSSVTPTASKVRCASPIPTPSPGS